MILFRLFALCLFVLIIGCGKNLEPKPEPKPEFKPEPKFEIKPAEHSVPFKDNKINNDGVMEVKVGERFDYGDLSITVIDVLNETEILAMDKRDAFFVPNPLNPNNFARFNASPVWLKFKNNSVGKIVNWPGFYNMVVSLEDEFGNKFRRISVSGWGFIARSETPDTGKRIDPGVTTHAAIYFEDIPTSSKKFVLTMGLEGKTIRCKGTLGEATRQEDNLKARDLKAAEEKKERDLMVAKENKERELKIEKEKGKQQRVVMEASRKKDLDLKNLPYYPLPFTKLKGVRDDRLLTADQWYKKLLGNVSNDDLKGAKESIDSLIALKDEGTPFLIDFLVRQTNSQDREVVLRNLYSCDIHPYDLPKIIDCLDKTKNQISARVVALNLLSKSENAKPYFKKIQSMTIDLLSNKNVKGPVKDDLDNIKN